MPNIDELIERGHVLLDGAWGTQLQELGLQTGVSSESWNMAFPEKVSRVEPDPCSV